MKIDVGIRVWRLRVQNQDWVQCSGFGVGIIDAGLLGVLRFKVGVAFRNLEPASFSRR